MIVEGSGDLLAADTEAVVNTVNCVGVMGKGIALQFKRRYPDVFTAYERACKAGEVAPGRMLPIRTGELVGPTWVINFPTKKHWRAPSRLEWIRGGLEDLKQVIHELGIKSIAIPPLGAGNGGLDWADVEPLIRAAFADDPHTEVHIYSPSKGRRSVLAAQRTPRITASRALLVGLVDQYSEACTALEVSSDNGVSHLEIQKLFYFANEAQPIPRMRFAQGKYGPYSEQIRHLLHELEGHFTTGYGDGADRVLELRPIEVTEAGRQQTLAYLERTDSDQTSEVIDRVLGIVSGFEGAYGLELLATTHWVVAQEGAGTAEEATNAVRKWSDRKGRIFTPTHVANALNHLRTQGMLAN
jgi:O-acetyl-ADP-ribose deacetylase (regulator of RNase III)